jgi:hypothetical protein
LSIPDPGSRVKKIPDPGSGSASKNLRIFNPKFFSKLSDPDLDFLPIPEPGSRGQKGTGSRIQIRNIDPAFSDSFRSFGSVRQPFPSKAKFLNFIDPDIDSTEPIPAFKINIL